MTAEQIEELIIALLPTITAIVGIVVSCVKMIKSFKTMKNELKSTNELKRIETQLKKITLENASLKRETRELYKLIKLRVEHIAPGVDNDENKKV